MNEFVRGEMLLGKDGQKNLSEAAVIVFGIGGVGGYAAEALVRSGIGKIALVDHDTVAESNINRQIIATHDTLFRKKTDVAKERYLSINPRLDIETFDEFYDENSKIDLTKYDYIVDAIDSISSKIYLIEQAKKLKIRIISCLSAGNKLDATAFRVGDIYATTVCPLAKIMRKKLREKGIDGLTVVWSAEEPQKPQTVPGERSVGSIAFVTGVCGLVAAGEVIKSIAFEKEKNKFL